MTTPHPEIGVLKHGIGYDLIVKGVDDRLFLGIRCHTCQCVSYNPNDITHRYCAACHVFYEMFDNEP